MHHKRLLACLPCWRPAQLSSHLAAKHQGVLLRAGHRVDQPTAIWQVRQQVLPIANGISQLLPCCLSASWGKLLKVKTVRLCSLLEGLQSNTQTTSGIRERCRAFEAVCRCFLLKGPWSS